MREREREKGIQWKILLGLTGTKLTLEDVEVCLFFFVHGYSFSSFFFARPEHQIYQKEEFRTDIESYRPTRPLGTLTNKSHAMQKDTDIDMVDDNFQSKHKSSGF